MNAIFYSRYWDIEGNTQSTVGFPLWHCWICRNFDSIDLAFYSHVSQRFQSPKDDVQYHYWLWNVLCFNCAEHLIVFSRLSRQSFPHTQHRKTPQQWQAKPRVWWTRKWSKRWGSSKQRLRKTTCRVSLYHNQDDIFSNKIRTVDADLVSLSVVASGIDVPRQNSNRLLECTTSMYVLTVHPYARFDG